MIKKELLPYLENILASVAVISFYFDIKKIKENLFYNFSVPEGRGDRIKIKLIIKK